MLFFNRRKKIQINEFFVHNNAYLKLLTNFHYMFLPSYRCTKLIITLPLMRFQVPKNVM